MTTSQIIKKAQEELNAMADRCLYMANRLERMAYDLNNATEGEEEADNGMEALEGLETVSKMLHAGQRPAVGQIILSLMNDGTEAVWRIIDTKSMDVQNGGRPVVAQLVEIRDYKVFSSPSKEYPWGCNRYDISDVAEWLDDEFMENLTFAAESCIIPRHDLGGVNGRKLWLLSDEEAGFGDLDKAFEWYACENEDARNERRQLKDMDGDAAIWWLRTPNSGHAYNVRIVRTSGTLNYYYANYAYGVSPACIIG